MTGAIQYRPVSHFVMFPLALPMSKPECFISVSPGTLRNAYGRFRLQKALEPP